MNSFTHSTFCIGISGRYATAIEAARARAAHLLQEKEEEDVNNNVNNVMEEDDRDAGLVVEPCRAVQEEMPQCGICMEEMDPLRQKMPFVLTKLERCGHLFHTECLRSCSAQWKNHCPLCRTYFSARRHLPIMPQANEEEHEAEEGEEAEEAEEEEAEEVVERLLQSSPWESPSSIIAPRPIYLRIFTGSSPRGQEDEKVPPPAPPPPQAVEKKKAGDTKDFPIEIESDEEEGYSMIRNEDPEVAYF